MEFNFNIEKLLKVVSNQGLAYISGRDANKFNYEDFKNINFLLDKIGELSATVIIIFI